MKIASICPSRAEELEGPMAIPSDATTVRPWPALCAPANHADHSEHERLGKGALRDGQAGVLGGGWFWPVDPGCSRHCGTTAVALVEVLRGPDERLDFGDLGCSDGMRAYGEPIQIG